MSDHAKLPQSQRTASQQLPAMQRAVAAAKSSRRARNSAACGTEAPRCHEPFRGSLDARGTSASSVTFRFGRAERLDDLDGIIAAAERSGAEDFLRQLPQGLETSLGKEYVGGFDLSLGQWQRVALARVFFRDAAFLVLDEPTASLDARSEHDLFQHVQRLAADRSLLLISHRFSTVKNADRIYVMHEGELIEEGSHDKLIARGGRYAELFDLQARAYR